MLLRPTLLTIVLIRTLALIHYAYTSTMLPDATSIAQDEQPTSVVRLRLICTKGLAQRRARVLLLTAYTARDFLLFCSFFVGVLGFFEDLGLDGGLRALAATRWFAHLFA